MDEMSVMTSTWTNLVGLYVVRICTRVVVVRTWRWADNSSGSEDKDSSLSAVLG